MEHSEKMEWIPSRNPAKSEKMEEIPSRNPATFRRPRQNGYVRSYTTVISYVRNMW